jgi:hypothetical protein
MKTVKIYQDDEGPVLCLNPDCGEDVAWLSDRKHYKAKELVPSNGGFVSLDVFNGKHEDRCESCDAPYYMQRVYDGGKYLGIKYKLLGLPVED